MHVHSKRRTFSLVLAALAVLSSGAALRPAAANLGGPPGTGPVAGPVEVFTHAEVNFTPLGALLETDLVVENHGDDPLTVFLVGQFTWPDGSTQLLRYGSPMTIDADGALVIHALSPIPDTAGSGTGRFTATAFVGRIGAGGRRDYPGVLIAQDSSTFELP